MFNEVLVPSGVGRTDGPYDLAQTEVDLSTKIQDLFGGTIDLGTDGFATMRWHRVGRMIEGVLFIYGDDDTVFPAGGPLCILGTDLPAIPRATPAVPVEFAGFFGEAGMFGFITDHTSTWFRPVSTGTNDVFASGSPMLVFPLADGNATGGLSALWSPTNPETLTGVKWSYRGKFSYEAAGPAS